MRNLVSCVYACAIHQNGKNLLFQTFRHRGMIFS
jgi:hypothetical protein